MTQPDQPRTSIELPRLVGFWGASGVMVGVMVGSGIFRTPATIAQHLDSPWTILAFWLAGGVLSLLGALVWAELASMHPRSGGIYVFLREAYGKPLAFTFGWTYMLVSKPYAAAGIAVIFAESILQLLGVQASDAEKRWLIPAITSVALIVLTLVNVWGVRQSTGLGIGLTMFKVAALICVIVFGGLYLAGFLDGAAGTSPGTPRGVNWAGLQNSGSIWLTIAPVMAAVLWTYDGWSDVGAIAGEVKEPSRLLPRVFVVNTAVITLIYILVNTVYLKMVPVSEMRGMQSLAPHVMGLMFGPLGASAVLIIIIVSTLGSSHASIMTGARVSFAQARDGLLFGFLGRVSPRFGTPAVALMVQLGLSITAVWMLGTFESLAGGFVFSIWIFYGLGAAAMIILRIRRPDAARPFRCPAGMVVATVFVLAATAMTVLAIRDSWKTTLPWVGVLAMGWPAYVIWQWVQKRRPA